MRVIARRPVRSAGRPAGRPAYIYARAETNVNATYYGAGVIYTLVRIYGRRCIVCLVPVRVMRARRNV